MKLKQKISFCLIYVMFLAIFAGCRNSEQEHSVTEESKTIPQTHHTQATEDPNIFDPSEQSIISGQSDDESLTKGNFEYTHSDVMPELEETYAPYVGLYCDVLDMSAAGYENKTGAQFFEKTNPDEQYYVRPSETIQYYWGTNEVLIGVRNNEICLVLSYTSAQVREVINSIGATALFEIPPAMCEVSNKYNSQSFFYWQIDNGYIGFIAIGGDDPSKCYNYTAHSLIFFEDLNDINLVKPISEFGIAISFAPEDYYLNPDNYEVYHFVDTEYGADIILTPNTEVTNFMFFTLDSEALVNKNEFVISEILFTKDSLSSDKPFITRIDYAGYLGPYYGLSYEDVSGKQYNFVIYESGENGSFYLEAF